MATAVCSLLNASPNPVAISKSKILPTTNLSAQNSGSKDIKSPADKPFELRHLALMQKVSARQNPRGVLADGR